MKNLDMDSGLTAVVDCVREVHTPIAQAITDREKVSTTDCAHLAGAVDALLRAIDARLPQREAQAEALKAVA